MRILRGLYYMAAGLYLTVSRFLCATFKTLAQLPMVIKERLATLYEQSKLSAALVVLPFVSGLIAAPFFTNSVLQGLLTVLTLVPVGFMGLQYYVWLDNEVEQPFVTFVHKGVKYQATDLPQSPERRAGWYIMASAFVALPTVQVVTLHMKSLSVFLQLAVFFGAVLTGLMALFVLSLALTLLHPVFVWVYSLGQSLHEAGRELHEPST